MQGNEPGVEPKHTGELAIGGLVGEGGAVDTGGRAEGAAVALAAETPGQGESKARSSLKFHIH